MRQLGRHALVIGANAYPGNQLINAVGDAKRVEEALRKRSFSVSTVIDPKRDAIEMALANFETIAGTAALALIYLAGHAVERHGTGFFLPVDFELPPTPGKLNYCAVSLNAFVAATSGAASRIVVLDACRNWPTDRTVETQLLEALDELREDERSWQNLLLAYATSATATAGDGVEGQGSVFSNSLCRHLLDHQLTVDECFRRVSQDVVDQFPAQQPWTYSSLTSTLSFTDLPRYAVLQRHALPNPSRLGSSTWAALDAEEQALIVGVGDNLAWRVDIAGQQQRHRGPDEELLMGAAKCGERFLLAGSHGALYIAGTDHGWDRDLPSSFGVKASPTTAGNLIHYGGVTVDRLKVQNDRLVRIARHQVGFDVYCCIHLPKGPVWVAGEGGRILEIDRDPSRRARPRTPRRNASHRPGSVCRRRRRGCRRADRAWSTWRCRRAPRAPLARRLGGIPAREVARLDRHVYAMAVAPSGYSVFVVGAHGLAVEMKRSGKIVAELLSDRSFQTAAGIREQLLHYSDLEIVRRFTFEPMTLEQETHQFLTDKLGVPDYTACAVAQNLPILAIATQESSVVLLDTRDRQVFQELDVGSGNAARVSGVHFLSDGHLAVVGGRGDVTFFAPYRSM